MKEPCTFKSQLPPLKLRLENLVREALKRGVKAEVYLDGDELCYLLHGFYKSNRVSLKIKSGTVIAQARYNEATEIKCWDDIVRLNFRWWQYSKDRFDGWKLPEAAFAEDFERLKLHETVKG